MAYILSKTLLCQATFRKNIILGSINRITKIKNYQHFTNKSNIYAERHFKLKDNISTNYKLIYREHKHVNLLTAVAHYSGWIGLTFGVLLAGYVIYDDSPETDEVTILSSTSTISSQSTGTKAAMIGFGILSSVVLIVSSTIVPFRIYYSATEKLYKAVFVRSILVGKSTVTFSEGTAVPKWFRKENTPVEFVNVKGYIILLDKDCFIVPYMYEKMIYGTN